MLIVGVLYLGALGCAGSGADPERRDAALHRAGDLPVLGALLAPLIEVLRLVAALAYFDDPRSQQAFRGAAPLDTLPPADAP